MRRFVVLLAGVVLLAALAMSQGPGASGSVATPPGGAACPTWAPYPGTPGPIAASPSVQEAARLPSIGTPVALPCLTVTLRADSTKAGPVRLTVEVTGEHGAPVTDATVVILTRHLEMNHGISTNKTVAEGPGRYVAEQVSMGMGGTWQAEVVITRPGEAQVIQDFVVKLQGPM